MAESTPSQTSSTLENAARFAGILIAAMYGAGFLVVLLHHSQYGIIQFNLFKSRIIAAGVLFFFLLGVPTASAMYLFTKTGIIREGKVQFAGSRRESLLKVSVLFDFYPYCVMLAHLSRFMFAPFREPDPWGQPLELAAFGLFALTIFLTPRYLGTYAGRCTLLSLTVALGVAVVQHVYMDPQFFALAGWYYAASVLTVATFLIEPKPGDVKKEDWGFITLILISFAFWFATAIYGAVKPAYGGGRPIPIIMHLGGKTPLAESVSAEVSLVDETDSGYYVIRRGETEAFYVPRSLVTAVRFMGEGDQKHRTRTK